MGGTHYKYREGVRIAHELGVKIATGTDCPSTPPWDIWDCTHELAELVGCGLTPLEAISAATRTAAEVSNGCT